MKRLFSFVGAMGTVLLASAQLTNISVETVLEHDGTTILPATQNIVTGDYECGPTGTLFVEADQNLCEYPTPELAGYTTYRIYANLTNEYDFVSSVYGDAADPMILGTTGEILQAFGGSNFAPDINPVFFPNFPTLPYDSWFTIGSENSNDPSPVSTTFSTSTQAIINFEAGQGFVISDPIGGAWFNTFPCTAQEDLATCSVDELGFAGENLKVLLGQITSTGDVYGMFNVQVFVAGSQEQNQLATGMTFSSNPADVFGCTDPNAENETLGATIDDLSCVFPCTLSFDSDNFIVTSPQCPGGNTGSISTAVTGAQGVDDYYFEDFDLSDSTIIAQNFGNFGQLVSGTYTVYVVDGAQCIDSVEVVVPAVDPIEIVATLSTPVSCHDASDAIITITETTGGNGNFQYALSSDPTNFSSTTEWPGLGGTNPGGQTYVINAVDANGCTGSSTPIYVANPLVFSVGLQNNDPSQAIANASCANIPDGEIFVVGYGGTPNAQGSYEFSVDGENYGPSPLMVAGGTYTVTARDVRGCLATVQNVVVGPDAIVINAVAQPEACVGDNNGNVSWAPVNGIGAYTYSFDGTPTTNTEIDDLGPGTYTVSVTDSNGCTESQSVEVAAATPIVVSASTLDASCFGDSDGEISVTATGGTGAFLYSDNGTNYSQVNVFGGYGAGTHTVFVQDELGCVESETVQVGEPSQIVIVGIVSEGAATGEGEIDVTVTGGSLPYVYEWIGDGVNGFDTQDLTGISTGTYIIEVTDINGCSSIETFNLTTDLKEIDTDVVARVYPNPSNGQFMVDIRGAQSGQVGYQVFDVRGRQMMSGQWSASNGAFKTILDLSQEVAGMYRLVMICNGRPSSMQLIKTN